ncbi:hypothetical protein ACUUL3_16220 [Thiovibrio sp. JS02]
MDTLHCQACHAKIPEGTLYYCCRTEIISGFDGILPGPEMDPEMMIQDACEEITLRPAQDLMDEVYQEIRMILCPQCRAKLRAQLLALRGPERKGGKVLQFPANGRKKFPQ